MTVAFGLMLVFAAAIIVDNVVSGVLLVAGSIDNRDHPTSIHTALVVATIVGAVLSVVLGGLLPLVFAGAAYRGYRWALIVLTVLAVARLGGAIRAADPVGIAEGSPLLAAVVLDWLPSSRHYSRHIRALRAELKTRRIAL